MSKGKRIQAIEMIHGKSLEISCLLTVCEMCDALHLSRATYYRWINEKNREKMKRPSPARKLSAEEEDKILSVLNSERFCDMAPQEIFHTLLDEGMYYCSSRTMYRILEKGTARMLRDAKKKRENIRSLNCLQPCPMNSGAGI